MHPAFKILIGALMIVVGVYSSVTFWDELLMVLKAGVGPLLVLIGAFIVWLESDEWKMMREQKSDKGLQQQFESEETFSQETEEETTTAEDLKQEVTDQEDEKHACPECGKEFDTERGMRIHKAQKHD